MKSRFNTALFIILVLQIGVAVSMRHVNKADMNEQFNQPIMDIRESAVDEITLDDGAGQSTVLSRVNQQWQLDNYHQLPADQKKVKAMLDKLEKDKSGWPVATTESSRIRFKVADNDYRKKLVLRSDAGDQALYLGVSPGFRQLNVRREGEEQVYSVKLNDYDFPVKDVDWMDKTLLQPKADISAIKTANFSLNKNQGKWSLENSEQAVDNNQLNKLTGALARLRVQSAEEQSKPADAYSIELFAGDKNYQYELFKVDDNYYISRNDFSVTFKISKTDYESLTVADASQLIDKSMDSAAPEKDAPASTPSNPS